MIKVKKLSLFKKLRLTAKSIYLCQLPLIFTELKEIVLKFKNGTKLFIRNKTSDLAEAIIINGDLEYPLRFVKNKKNMTIVDIGANIGAYSLYISKYLATNNVIFKTYAIEPERSNFEQLQRNIILNKMDKYIIPLKIAISDTNGVGNLKIGRDKDSHKITKKRLGTIQSVKIKTFKTFCKSFNINKIDILKIDIEGGEYRVLDKSINFFKKVVNLLYVELHPLSSRRNITKYSSFLSKNGFRIYKSIMNRTVVAVNTSLEG